MRRRFSRKERLALAIAAGFKCEVCGDRLDAFEADHKRPWSKGGQHAIDNLQTLCKPCNVRKGAR